jgi:pimeloyl-ACP methyl ester carboxylesterase
MTKTIPSMTVAAAAGLPKAHVPVLMVYGGKDALVNPEPSIARAQALNSTIKTAVYANSGHAPFLEEAPRFNRDLAEFGKASTSE